MLRSKKWLLFFILPFALHLNAQEQLGLRLDRHSGILGSQLNPSSLATSALRWDINLVSAGIHFDNEYAFIRNANLIDVSKGRSFSLANSENHSSSDLVIDFFDRNKKMNATALAFGQGLSGFFSLKDHRIGFSFRARSFGSATRIPTIFGYDAYNRLPIDTTTTINHSAITAMNWGEIAIHYATTIKDNRNSSLAIGGNLKYLMGYDAAFINVSKNTQVTKLTNQLLAANEGIIHVGAATNFLDSTSQNNGYEVLGNGLGLDIGMTIVEKSNTQPYTWKLGFSILDIGGILYNKNARSAEVNLSEQIQFAQDSFGQLNNTDATIDELIEQANTTLNGVNTQTKFSMGLPTALSVQYDRPISNVVFVNATWVQRLSMGDRQAKRRNLFAVSPRLDFGWWGVQMPLSWVDYKQIQWGASVRVGPLTVGSERLNTVILKQNQFSGSDLYVSLKIDSFTFKKKGNHSKVKCWD